MLYPPREFTRQVNLLQPTAPVRSRRPLTPREQGQLLNSRPSPQRNRKFTKFGLGRSWSPLVAAQAFLTPPNSPCYCGELFWPQCTHCAPELLWRERSRLMGLTKLVIRGARQHNLKNISLEIPRNTLTVITGLSGSGKSSLAFDTIYAEGQRRYVESLSAYARQFLDQMERPEVDVIEGLSPSIAIEQKTTTRSPRSTVGTITEIYDYLRVVYSSVGVPHCPNCGKPITRQSSEQIVQAILHGELCKPDDRIMILAPIVRGRKGAYRKELEKLAQDGFVRVRINGELLPLDEIPK